MRKLAMYAAALGALALASCSDKKDDYVERPVDKIYNKAVDDLQNGLNRTSAKEFDEVERQHPYSAWATKAQLMSAYSYYLANDYDQAVVALELLHSLQNQPMVLLLFQKILDINGKYCSVILRILLPFVQQRFYN